MSRVLIPDGPLWYDELKAVGYYGESELERMIRQHVTSLFPDFYVFPFKKDVTNRISRSVKRPDLAMVRRDLSAWGVIEVELSEHNLEHVLAQTTCFANGEYNAPEIAKYIRDQIRDHCNKRIPLVRLGTLIRDEVPKVLVVADSHVEDWIKPLNAIRADLCVFQIFKNTLGHYLYRTLGAYPVVPLREVHCRRDSRLPNVLEIVGHFRFRNLGQNREVDILFDTSMTRWVLVADAGKSYLRFIGKVNPLPANATYCLFADRTGRYHFRIN